MNVPLMIAGYFYVPSGTPWWAFPACVVVVIVFFRILVWSHTGGGRK